MDLDNLKPRADNHEAAMARADLYKLANYSMKLFKMIQEGQELEGWVQAKITKAADYIASVYHFMEYEMKVSEYGETLENAEMYSESVRRAFAQKLYEAKCKMKEMSKKNQKDLAVKEAKDDEPAEPDPELIAKRKAREAAQRRREEKEEADKDDLSKDYKPRTSAKSGTTKVAGKAYGGAKQKDLDEAAKPDFLDVDKDGNKKEPFKKAVKDKKIKEASKPDFLDMDKDGDKKEPMKKAIKDKKVKESAPLTPQQAAELAKSSDPNAYNKMTGQKTPTKTTMAPGFHDTTTAANKAATKKPGQPVTK